MVRHRRVGAVGGGREGVGGVGVEWWEEGCREGNLTHTPIRHIYSISPRRTAWPSITTSSRVRTLLMRRNVVQRACLLPPPVCLPLAYPHHHTHDLTLAAPSSPPPHHHNRGRARGHEGFLSVWIYKSPDGDKDLSLSNLEVINLLKSLKSSGYVKETFNWCAPWGK